MKNEGIWNKLLNDIDFKQKIEENGYYRSPLSFQPFVQKYGLNPKNRAPAYLSIDLWKRQHLSLRNNENDLYVIRTGKGSFVIFSNLRFPKPYLELNRNNAEDIPIKDKEGFSFLKDAFKRHYQEDANLELPHMLGVYDELVKRVCKTSDYLVGPRGGRNSTFKFYMRDKENSSDPIPFDYNGQEQLDYTIWTKDSVLVFEAKQYKGKSYGLDIGWHKLIFPALRFKRNGLRVYPVYYLRLHHTLFIFVFSPLTLGDDIFVLNDVSQLTPRAYKVDLSPIMN